MDKALAVNVSVKEGIGELVFCHAKGNSLPRKLLTQIAQGITDLGKDPEARIIVLKSGGDGAFCAGASFDELKAVRDIESGKHFFSGFAEVILAIREAPKFVIARVQGKAVGGGVGLVAAADYAIASSSASIRLSELALGIGPFVVGPAVERKIGAANFSALSVDADWRDANWAKEKGLYTEVCSSLEVLDQTLERFCTKLSCYSPVAMAELKRVLWRGTEDWTKLLFERAGVSGRLVLTTEARKAIEAVS